MDSGMVQLNNYFNLKTSIYLFKKLKKKLHKKILFCNINF